MITVERMKRSEWLERNPTIKKFISINPSGWKDLEAFSLWPEVETIEGIDSHQREELSKALSGPIGILGGSPGTGKTWTVAKLITCLLDSGLISQADICIGAPTGKAAVRLTENLQANGLAIRARTWHSLLGIGKASKNGEFGFKHNEENPLPYRIFFGDEESMKDLSLMLSVFKAMGNGAHFLIVGDINQIPPVGNGAPLRDFIEAGIPYGELTEIKRNSGGIVEACGAIRDGKPWLHFATAPNSNIRITGDSDSESKIERIVKLIREAERNGLDPIWDCQVLVAVNEKSPLSRKAINELLQNELNDYPKVNGTIFRKEDKVVCLKNGFFKPWSYSSFDPEGEDVTKNDSGEVFVANGELGEVLDVTDSELIVRLDGPSRKVSIPLRRFAKESSSSEEGDSDEPKANLSNWDLGYALSVHKSQGSEWPVVITVLDEYPGARMICDRAWIYTAISRAKSKSFLVGTPDLAERFCRVAKISQRKTFLSELIRSEIFKLSLGDL